MYTFNDAGLENIKLENGYVEHKTRYGNGVSYESLDDLTQQVCIAISLRPGRLSGIEFRYIRRAINLSQAALGELFGRTEQTIANWEKNNNAPLEASILIKQKCLTHFGKRELIGVVLDQLGTTDISTTIISMNYDETSKKWTSNFHTELNNNDHRQIKSAGTFKTTQTEIIMLSCNMPIYRTAINRVTNNIDGFPETPLSNKFLAEATITNTIMSRRGVHKNER